MLAAMLVTMGIGIPVILLTQDDRSYPDRWDARVVDLVAFVERERGLAFDHPVPVDFLTTEEYADRTRIAETDLNEEERTDLEQLSSFLRAVGLASGDVDIIESANDLADAGTLAFYDPTTKRVVVRGTEMTVNLEVTLVHELTHVLQDQHFGLLRMYGDQTTEAGPAEQATRAEAMTALIEGDAMRIEFTYVDQLSTDELDEYTSTYDQQLAEAEASLADVPSALIAFQTAPYVLGQPLVEIIAAAGGDAAVDDAFADPPTTAEHMFDPRTYLDGQTPTELDQPELPDGIAEETDSGPLGAVTLYLVLAERIDPVAALEAADGWGNGRYASYENDEGRSCVRLAVDGDTDTDDQQLQQVFDSWIAATPPEAGASVTDLGGGHTLVESCDPGSEVDAINDRALDVLAVPAARSQSAVNAIRYAGASLDEGWSSGNCLVRELTVEELASSEVTPEITEALSTCSVF